MNIRSTFAKEVRAGTTRWTAGVFDALSARVAQQSGFPAVMTTGFGISASLLGQPDAELYTLTENVSVVRNVVNAVTVPVIADADTGYGNAINVMRTVRELEQAGVSGLILEDQLSPKRCPAIASAVELIPVREGVAKIKAAVEARRDADLVIVARTDAMTESEAIDRAGQYAQAGADLIQPISPCFNSYEGLKRLRAACGKPLSLQIVGWLESDLSAAQIEELAGLAVYPLNGIFTVAASLAANYSSLWVHKSARNLPAPALTMKEFKDFIGFAEMEALQKRLLSAERT